MFDSSVTLSVSHTSIFSLFNSHLTKRGFTKKSPGHVQKVKWFMTEQMSILKDQYLVFVEVYKC